MLFNSVEFLVFLGFVFGFYWFLFSKSKDLQNGILVLSSFIFYSFWDWRFSALLLLSVFINYFGGLFIEEAGDQKKKYWALLITVILNLGILIYFKYFNFFIDSFATLLSYFGYHGENWVLSIVLPIGISFYTFHGLSYILDIYYSRIRTNRNILEYTLFVSYFPLLVAGPIERATHLLPQLKNKRIFNYQQGIQGLELILWGFFKKLVIADTLAPFVAEFFNNPGNYNSATLILGVIAFAFQVYGDFSGYTDIARGVSKLFGIELLVNFRYPYFSRSIPEFWSRWHMSLSSWLNDYVFMPIALRFRGFGRHGIFIAVFLTFLISGFWHGAAWHFVIWGAYHGILYIPFIYRGKGLKSMFGAKQKGIDFKDYSAITVTFIFVLIGYVLFRADSLRSALNYYSGIILDFSFQLPSFEGKIRFLITMVLVLIMLILEVIGFHHTNPISIFSSPKLRLVRWALYAFILFLIGVFMNTNVSSFIYFQF